MRDNLDLIFSPASIAVIGASSRKGSVGFALLDNIVSAGYKGAIYPVNPKHNFVQGIAAYKNIGKVPEKVDLAIIVTPAKTVPGIVKECGRAGVGGLVIISGGFKEIGEEGQKMADDILKTIRRYDMRLVGPNCLGFINPELNLNASFGNKMAKKGNMAFISQSGALCTAILDWADSEDVGFSHFVSIGSMVDIGFHDLIDYFGSDPNTSSILIYMESLTDARKFISSARAFSRTKPIIVLKAGKSAEGAKVALSHTGTIAGNDEAFDAAFRRAGIIRAATIEQLFDCAKGLSKQPLPLGNKLAVITNSGGPGVMATDYLLEHGGKLARFGSTTFSHLNEILPEAWSRRDPVDVLGDTPPARYREAARLLLEDENVDGLLAIMNPQAVISTSAVAENLVTLNKIYDKPILAVWMGEQGMIKSQKILEAGGIPTYHYPENAVDVFLKMYNYSKNLKLLYETPTDIPQSFMPDTKGAKSIIKKVIKSGRLALTEGEGKQLLASYDIPVTDFTLATTEEEAKSFAANVGFPLVMKIVSPDIQHKTDIGGVVLNIETEAEAVRAFKNIIKGAKKAKPKADIHGVLMEKMISKKYELLIGGKKDSIFGPLIVFGMGGIAVEIYNDINFGLPPLNMALAQRIIENTKIYKLLRGYRGIKGVDIKSIQFLLYKFAYLLMDFPEIKELDINPFVVDEKGGVVIDAKVILDENVIGKKIKPYSHLVISPYPRDYVTTFTLKDGRKAILRPVRPEDEPMMEEMFYTLSKQTKYFRFFKYVPEISHEALVRYTQIDYDREIAIIAELEEKGKKVMAGVVRLISDAIGRKAEFAIVVADPWQHQGLGNKLMDYIIEIAKKKKIKKIYAMFLPNNKGMAYIFKKKGFVISAKNVKTMYAELTL